MWSYKQLDNKGKAHATTHEDIATQDSYTAFGLASLGFVDRRALWVSSVLGRRLLRTIGVDIQLFQVIRQLV